ncbi:MAG: helix-turn-helix transcriptional regulator, partial [candidate division WOR-3 bacterium]
MKSNRLNTPGLFELLRSARLNSGLSQAQVGAALGMERRYAKSFISRLERGALANPSLRVVIDFLRACKADPTEVAEAFKRWLSIPLSVPEHRAGPRTKARPRPEDKANLELRRQAAWYTLAQVLEYFLHHEFGALGLSPDEPWRKVSARLARRTFRILYETRTGDEKQRARRLGRIRAWARSKALPEELIEHIGTRVTGLFCDMVKDGDLEWLPSLEDARSTMALAPRARILTDEQMCRQARLEQKAKEHAAFRQKYETLLEKAKALLG